MARNARRPGLIRWWVCLTLAADVAQIGCSSDGAGSEQRSGAASRGMTDGAVETPPGEGLPNDRLARDEPKYAYEHAPSGLCLPDAGGTVFGLEGDELVLTLSCATGAVVSGDQFVWIGLPSGAQYDAQTRTLRWTPALDQASVYELEVSVPALHDYGVVRVEIADRFDHPDNVLVDPLTYTSEYGLPVFHLTTVQKLNDDEHTPVELVYRGHAFVGAEAKYRGHRSRLYPKRSFTIKLPKDDLLSDLDHELVDKRRIVLTAMFDDNSYARQWLAFELWNRLHPTVHVTVYTAVLFRNGSYAGLYLVSDHVDDELMDESGLGKDGNLYKARSHDANFRLEDAAGQPKVSLDLGYTKEEGEPAADQEGAFDDLEAFVTWVATAPQETFDEQLESILDRDDFEDWLILISTIDARDSAGKNSYLYHDPALDALDARWHCVPWDFNASFGQAYTTHRIAADDPLESFDGANALFERFTTDPARFDRVAQRARDALRDSWSLARVLALFDAHVLENDLAALRDEQLWGAAYRGYDWHDRQDLLSYEQEVAYVRQWIIDRWAVANDHFR